MKIWITQEILDKVRERNYWRKRDIDEYKQLKNTITTECRKAKEQWMEEISKEIVLMINRHNDGVYAKVKKLQYNPRRRSNIVKSKEGRILFDNEKIAKRWKEYIEEL